MQKNRKPRVLITYIESGMGHIMSARAVAEGLRREYGDSIELIETEIMQDGNRPEQIRFEHFLTLQTKATNKFRWFGPPIFSLMELGKLPLMRFLHSTVFKKATAATISQLESFRPDIVVSTHYFITLCAVELKRQSRPDLLVACYNPDNNVHVWWDNRSDLFITNNQRAAEEAVNRRHFAAGSVRTTFFTARPCVAEASGTRQEYRARHGIPQDKFCVVLADGAYADGRAARYCEELLKSDRPLTLILLAGKNAKVLERFRRRQASAPPNITLIPLGFTEEAYELYGAADLFITKAGPNAILDSLFMGTPVLVNLCPHPIERASCDLFVRELGCGLAEFNPRRARAAVERFADRPELLEKYRRNILIHLDKTQNGAAQTGRIIMETWMKRHPAERP